MDFAGERVVAAGRDRVWAALNDPVVLAACLPGCERFDRNADDGFTAVVAVRIGSLAARFSGTVTLTEAAPPEAVTLVGQGQGGVAGFARGTARLALEDRDGATLLRWMVGAEIGGRLATLGGRLIHAFTASMTDKFFTNLAKFLS